MLPDFIRRAVIAAIDLTKGAADKDDSAKIGSSGDSAQIGSSGDRAQIVAEGENAVIACAGSAVVTAAEGGAFCIPYSDGKRARFAIGYVGEDGLKPAWPMRQRRQARRGRRMIRALLLTVEQYPARMGFLATILSLVLVCAALPTPAGLS